MTGRRAIPFFFWMIMSFAIRGEAQELYYRHLEVKDGLPSSEVYDVLQDHDGYMWFSTDAGVARYDGYGFEVYTIRDGLPDNTIFGLAEDRHGRIWFRSYSGKIAYRDHGVITTIGASDSLQRLVTSGYTSNFYVDAGDTVWCSIHAFNSAFVCIAPPYQHLTIVPCPSKGHVIESHLPGQALMCTQMQPGDTQVFQTVSRNQHLRSAQFDQVAATVTQDRVCESKGVFVASTGSDLFRIGPGGAGGHYHFSDSLAAVRLAFDKDNDLLVGTFGHGLFRFRNGDLNQAPEHLLDDQSVSGFCEDREGGLWLTTLDNGVLYVPDKHQLYYNRSTGLSGNKIYELCPIGDSLLLAAVTTTSVVQFNVRNFQYRTYNRLSANYQITPIGADSIMLCGFPNLLFLSKRHEAVNGTRGKNGRPANLRTYALTGNGTLYGGTSALIGKISRSNLTMQDSVTVSSRINRIFGGRGDTLWIGCMNGLWCYDGKQLTYFGDRDPLLKNRVDDCAVDAAGALWLATHGNGIIIFHGKNCTQLTIKNGLPSDICQALSIDSDGEIWAATNNGICRIRNLGGGYAIRNYNSSQGLMADDVNDLLRIGDQLWAATDQGVICMNVDRLDRTMPPPQIHLSKVRVNGKPVEMITRAKELRYDENFIRFDFVGMTYGNFGNTVYRYRLLGLDTVWQVLQQRSIQFTTLPPGDYTFEVVALNSNGTPSAEPASYHFLIYPPYWRTWWFFTGLLLLIMISIYVIFRYRVRQLQRRETEKAEISKQIAEMKLQALRAQINPHFIFNAFHSIQHFILKQETHAAHKYLSKFAQLIRNVLEYSGEDFIPLSKEIETLRIYIELEALRFGEKLTYTIEIDPSIDTGAVRIPPMLIQPFVENAIWHGLMHKEGGGHLILRMQREPGLIRCTVEDDGIGRARSAEYNRHRAETHRSLGQQITAERIALNNRLYRERFSVKIIDKHDAAGQATGTCVEIEIPVT